MILVTDVPGDLGAVMEGRALVILVTDISGDLGAVMEGTAGDLGDRRPR